MDWQKDDIREVVNETAPKVFAIVVTYENPYDEDWVAAWGMAYQDKTFEVATVDGDMRLRVCTLDWLLAYFGRDPVATARVEWPAAA
ncbi:hypothetical protein [Streptomyces mayteni]